MHITSMNSPSSSTPINGDILLGQKGPTLDTILKAGLPPSRKTHMPLIKSAEIQ